MEAPKPTMIKNDIVFKLKDKENTFTLKFSDENGSLGISISEDDSVPPINYSTNFPLTELTKLSRYFKLFESIEDLLPEIKNLCDQNQVKITKEKELLNLTLVLPLKIVAEVCLPIPQEKEDPNKIIIALCHTVNELNKKIKSLITGEISEEQLEENLKSKDILKNEDEKNMIINWILKSLKQKEKKVNMTLLYKLTLHGDSASTFHSKCNNKGPTLTLIRNIKGYRCGGFTNQSWSSRYDGYNGYGNPNVEDPNAFLFSLDYKEKYPSFDGKNAIYDNSAQGPSFGGGSDLSISDSCTKNNCSCNFPNYYCGTRVRALSGGINNFKVNEIEVFKIEII